MTKARSGGASWPPPSSLAAAPLAPDSPVVRAAAVIATTVTAAAFARLVLNTMPTSLISPIPGRPGHPPFLRLSHDQRKIGSAGEYRPGAPRRGPLSRSGASADGTHAGAGHLGRGGGQFEELRSPAETLGDVAA